MIKGRVIFFILLAATSLLFALLAGGRFPYLIFTILMLIFLTSYISVLKNQQNLVNFFWINTKKASVGDMLELGYKINNTGIFPVTCGEVSCHIADRLGGSIPSELLFMHPFQITSMNYKIVCKHRGFYHIGKISIKVTDSFHLFEKIVDFDHSIQLEVYPRVVILDRFNIPATEFFGTVRVPHNTYEDYTSIESIRKYQQGDSIKKIHWKISGKNGDLFVKNYELSANTRVHIFLDGYKGNYSLDVNGELEEKITEAAASIIRYCLVHNLSTSFISHWGERSFIEGRDMGKFQIFLKELMHFVPNGNMAIEDVLITERRLFSWGATLIILAVYLTDSLFSTILNLREKRYNLMVLIINNLSDRNDEKMNNKIETLKKAGIDFYSVKLENDIRNILGDLL